MFHVEHISSWLQLKVTKMEKCSTWNTFSVCSHNETIQNISHSSLTLRSFIDKINHFLVIIMKLSHSINFYPTTVLLIVTVGY
jgi:hypothetical protein